MSDNHPNKSLIGKVKSSRHIVEKTNSFCLPKRDESMLGISLCGDSSGERTMRHLIFQKKTNQRGVLVAQRLGDFDEDRSKKHSRKPNSFTQIIDMFQN